MIHRFIVITSTETILVEVKTISYNIALQKVIDMYPYCEVFTSIKQH